MAKFMDCEGREWTLRLTLGHRAALRELGVDTKDFAACITSIATATGTDAEKLVAVCHVLTVGDPDPEDYAKGFDADTIDRAGEALADAVVGFFLSRQPKLAAVMRQRVREVWAKMDAKAAERLTRSGLGTN